ncbi:50S ribosomal protein L4 [Candidatus Pacearchaeota archaeon]|nr:50S ribosomal protein L4 [Candidatus Pacearchaeota archaeon]
MKIQVLDIEGKKTKEITTKLFEEPIREDIIYKVVEAEKIKQPYAPKQYAGMNRSASGSVLHTRHDWKSDRGRGMSRYPKKKMWRRGTQFSWVAAIIPSARGGRRAHPPRVERRELKINKKEALKALFSSLTYVSSLDHIIKKYYSLENKKIEMKFPLVVEDKILTLKSKDFLNSLKKILGELYSISVQKKTIRAGKGKQRGRKYKKNAGLLLIIGNNENMKSNGIENLKVKDLRVSDLAECGARITMFTENAIKDLEMIGEKSK